MRSTWSLILLNRQISRQKIFQGPLFRPPKFLTPPFLHQSPYECLWTVPYHGDPGANCIGNIWQTQCLASKTTREAVGRKCSGRTSSPFPLLFSSQIIIMIITFMSRICTPYVPRYSERDLKSDCTGLFQNFSTVPYPFILNDALSNRIVSIIANQNKNNDFVVRAQFQEVPGLNSWAPISRNPYKPLLIWIS